MRARINSLAQELGDSKCISNLKEKRRNQRTYTNTNPPEKSKLNEVIEEWEVLKTQLRDRSTDPDIKKSESYSPGKSAGSFIDMIRHSSETKNSSRDKPVNAGKILFGRKKHCNHNQLLVSHDEELLMKLLHFQDEMLNKKPRNITKASEPLSPQSKMVKKQLSSRNLRETSFSPPKGKQKQERSFLLKTMRA
ncbi:unnamed protein product [Blepharisma stoltei]|uniref:Uncharacterized protein n=1 Tax=Blepharisma stoltei TaxID=1481888 RepID=A0AAU9J553_9CILI|nr:unnamed protein product [Blepharisma stoltei]